MLHLIAGLMNEKPHKIVLNWDESDVMTTLKLPMTPKHHYIQ